MENVTITIYATYIVLIHLLVLTFATVLTQIFFICFSHNSFFINIFSIAVLIYFSEFVLQTIIFLTFLSPSKYFKGINKYSFTEHLRTLIVRLTSFHSWRTKLPKVYARITVFSHILDALKADLADPLFQLFDEFTQFNRRTTDCTVAMQFRPRCL